MPETSSPPVVFLGFAERATLVRDGGTDALKWNVHGLKNILLTNFFPTALNNWNLGLAIRISDTPQNLKINFLAESGEEIGSTNIKLIAGAPTLPLTHSDSVFIRVAPRTWLVAFFELRSDTTLVIQKPGRYSAVIQDDDNNQELIGEFDYVLVEPPPLTPERVAAIKSDPNAVKAVRAVFGCTACASKCQVYAALERNPKLETEGFTWYADIPEHFACECGKAQLDLSTVKRNFFALLGQPQQALSREVAWAPLYEKSAIESLRVEFLGLVNANPPEESLQNFIENNPVILHQFPAEKLFFKPPILTQFKADFAIVTPQKELVLIEIERASTRLLRSDGGQHSDLTHAFGQVQSWLHEANEHRLAVLDSLSIPREMVAKVRGVVIAGRDAGNDASHLRRLKGSDQGPVTLLTYDDLAASLAALAQRLGDF
jgi:hypothetical protein